MNEKVPPLNPTVRDGIEKQKRFVPFLINGKEEVRDRAEVMEALGVKDIIRFQESDFPHIEQAPGSQFSHFNLGVTVNTVGDRYLLTEIIESRQPEPFLNLDTAHIAMCTAAESHMPYESLTKEQLAKSLGDLKTVPALLAAMVKRYAKTRKMTEDEIRAAGLGYTGLEMVGPAPTLQSSH